MAKQYKPHAMELVEVEWTDSFYDPTYDGDPAEYSTKVARLLNIGYFIKRGRDGIVLASCREATEGTVRHMMTIPRENVRGIYPCQRKEG